MGPLSVSPARHVLLILAACLCLFSTAAPAQPAFSESFFIAPGESDGESLQAVETCGQTFRQPLLQSGAFIERQTPEVAQVVSECVGSTASSSFARECDLATAQSQVDVIILLQATETPRGWLFQGTAMSPLQAGAVWADSVLVEEQHAVLAGLDACARLGHSFLVGRGVEAGAVPQTAAAMPSTGANQAPTQGRLEIIDVTPSPVTVLVNGAEVGLGPGQFLDLPLGSVELTLRATGHQDLSRSVELTSERMETLRGLSLEPLPATLVIASNVEGAEIRVRGSAIGVTRGGSSVPLQVAPGQAVVVVSREGYTTFEQMIELAPGAQVSVAADLTISTAPVEPAPRPAVPAGASSARGPSDAPVTILMFGDFQCPFSWRSLPTIEQIDETYDGRVRFVFKAFPLAFHTDAHLASEAALAAGEQGKFWEYHDLLFENQPALGRSDLDRYAERLGLDMTQFRAALDSGRHAAQVEAEMAEGREAGVRGTPTFLINGETLQGAQPFSAFQPIIDRHLGGL